ncbi:Terminase [Salininema proteolyticum]|uniref:Terminase n=1 Tax=Salininema proteolyticum TaxID=1607685 RepID=A0ABV8TWZ8_9ACTN
MPRELIYAPDHDRDRSLGHLAWDWIEYWCVHGPGDVQGDALELDGEFGGFIVDAYALRPADGRRLYDTAILSRAKGRAKSELAAFITLFEALGPSRFAGYAEGGETVSWNGWSYTYAPGEPMGKPITYPLIRCLATEEGQTSNTYDNVYFNLSQGPLSEALPSGAAGLGRVILPDGGEIRPSTASSSSKDGGKESFVVADETHLYTKAELKAMYRTVDRNLSKRKQAQPWILQTTTMYQTGEASVAEAMHERAKLIAEGKARSARHLWDHREAPAEVDMTDREQMRAALREVYGPFADVLDLDSIIETEFWDTTKDIEDARRYFFNQPTAARDAWVTKPDWDACARTDLIVADDAAMVLFFDGSLSDDATGLVGCDVETGHVMTLAAWEKPEGRAGEDWRVDKRDVDRVVRKVFEERNVVAFHADVAHFESYIDEWAQEFGDRLVIDASTGRYPHPIAWDMRGHGRDFVQATERALTDILEGDLTHDGDSRLTRHVLNARRRPNKWGVGIGKEGRESPRKVDLAVCMIGACMVRRVLVNSPAWKRHLAGGGHRRAGRVVGWN